MRNFNLSLYLEWEPTLAWGPVPKENKFLVQYINNELAQIKVNVIVTFSFHCAYKTIHI